VAQKVLHCDLEIKEGVMEKEAEDFLRKVNWFPMALLFNTHDHCRCSSNFLAIVFVADGRWKLILTSQTRMFSIAFPPSSP
jgi:hypothetical protein